MSLADTMLPAFWEMDTVNDTTASLTIWLQRHVKSAAAAAKISEASTQLTLFHNLIAAVTELQVVEAPIPEKDAEEEETEDEDDNYEPRKKKRKTTVIRRFLRDPCKIWFQIASTAAENSDGDITDGVLWDEDQDDIPETAGGKLAVLSVGGLLNGMAGQPVCKAPNSNPKALFKEAVTTGLADQLAQKLGGGVSVLQLHNAATSLHIAIADQVKLDILRTTPQRIQTLLASDLTQAEFVSVRKRVYDTVILGKGMHLAEESGTDLPTAASGAMHDIEKFKKCTNLACGNNDQVEFILDRKNGDVICSKCGTVVSESIMHEGSQFRKFEGEVDRNHHGDGANPLYSNAYNMGTSLSGVAPTTGAGIGGWGSGGGGGKRNLETILKNAHAYTELNVSQFGKTDRRTRIGYKDRQKKDAFTQMIHAGDSLNLHEAVVQRAKELFAGFRDDRELIQQFKGVLAACLCEAFEQLSAEGKHLLRQQQQMQDQQEQQYALAEDGKPKSLSARAARRNDLHHADLAGKGGLLLNETVKTEVTVADANGDNGNEKPAATWDLEDCRSWLLEASRSIAQSWVEERKKNTPASKKIPTVPLGELEGQLVEHAITLCEHLEMEMQSRNAQQDSRVQRVVTPRVADMTKLGIKWQHSHERGSGGKGGVGGSGTTSSIVTANGRTAGQILLLKTAKKLGSILNDPIAGEAIHRELRGVIGKQEARKQKEMREEATRQRFNQMQRKPWLTARVQQ